MGFLGTVFRVKIRLDLLRGSLPSAISERNRGLEGSWWSTGKTPVGWREATGGGIGVRGGSGDDGGEEEEDDDGEGESVW